MRKSTTLAVLLCLLFALPVFTGAEEAEPATPTDLDCVHEHTRIIIYFFDSPVYKAVSAFSHRVSGPAQVDTVCQDCGEVLSSDVTERAEEIRLHNIKNGTCALCGYREKNHILADAGTDLSGERTFFVQPEEHTEEDMFSLTLSESDFAALSRASVKTALARAKSGRAAVALDVQALLNMTRAEKASLYLEMAEREDGSVFAGLFLVPDRTRRDPFPGDGAGIRFYREAPAEDARVSLTSADAGAPAEQAPAWNAGGYWSVPYTEEGTYFLQEKQN